MRCTSCAAVSQYKLCSPWGTDVGYMWTGKIPFIFNPFLDHLSLFWFFLIIKRVCRFSSWFRIIRTLLYSIKSLNHYACIWRFTRPYIREETFSFPCELKNIQYSVKVIYSFSSSVYSSLGAPIISRPQVLFPAIISNYRSSVLYMAFAQL